MSYVTTTLADLQARLAERYDSSPYWTADQARRAINEALRLWNAYTGFWRTRVTLVGGGVGGYVPDDPFVPLAGTLAYKTTVEYLTTPLLPTSLMEMSLLKPTWMSDTCATGGSVPTLPVYWFPISLNQFCTWPAPPAGGTLYVNGIRATPTLVNAGDFLNLGDEEHDVILGYALHRLSLSQGATALNQTKPLFQAFLKAAALRNSLIAASSFYRRAMGIDQTRRMVFLRKPTKRGEILIPVESRVSDTEGA